MDNFISSQIRAASPNLKLAEKHYKTRLEELRGLILAEEVKFKCAANFYHSSVFKYILFQGHSIRN